MRDKFDCFNAGSENLCGAEELMRRTRSLKSGGIDLDGYYRTTKVSSFLHVAKPKMLFFVLLGAFCKWEIQVCGPLQLHLLWSFL